MGWETGTKREFKFDPNSTENEGRWRLYAPGQIEPKSYFRRKSSTAGVSYVMGKAKDTGKTVIQAVRFDLSKFSESEAEKWWSKNKGRDNLVFSDERKKEAGMDREERIAGKVAKKVMASESLLDWVIKAEDVAKLDGVVDEQTYDLAVEVYKTLRRDLALSSNQNEALNKLARCVQRGANMHPAGHRNEIFKAAHALGIKLPSGMF